MWNKVGELVLLDYLGKAVRQVPSRRIFAGDRVTYAGVATNMTTDNSSHLVISNHQYATFMWCIKLFLS